jgi:hypothetical protein
MKSHILLAGLAVLIVFSCKKNNDTKTPQPAGAKLAKMVIIDGQYTQTTFYTYDADGKLSTLRETESGGGSYSESGFRLIRKGGGMLERIIFRNAGSADSTTITISTNGQQYASAEWLMKPGSPIVETRKITFVTNSEGQITEATKVDYYGTTADPKSRTTFAYINNNLTAEKLYRISGGTNNLADQYDMEYDSKTNPLASGAEWLVLSSATGHAFWQCSANNLTKLMYQDVGQPTETYNFTYTYNNKGLPVSASFKSSDPSQPVQTIAYTYE